MENNQDNLPGPTDVNTNQHSSQQTTKSDMFQSINFGLRGVGGWLLFFVIGVGILRPLYTFGQMGNDKTDLSRLAERFPLTVTLIHGERIVFSAIALFGIVVAITLWKVRKPISVTLAKIFLICNAIIPCLDVIIFHNYADVPPQVISNVESRFIIQAIATVILSVLWFFYFLRSERVRATYLSGPYLH